MGPNGHKNQVNKRKTISEKSILLTKTQVILIYKNASIKTNQD